MNPLPARIHGDALSSDFSEAPERRAAEGGAPAQRNIADAYRDLMCHLTAAQRRGWTARLATGYYEGWRPSRDELADLVAVELGVLTLEESVERIRARRRGQFPPSVIGRLHQGRQYPQEGAR